MVALDRLAVHLRTECVELYGEAVVAAYERWSDLTDALNDSNLAWDRLSFTDQEYLDNALPADIVLDGEAHEYLWIAPDTLRRMMLGAPARSSRTPLYVCLPVEVSA